MVRKCMQAPSSRFGPCRDQDRRKNGGTPGRHGMANSHAIEHTTAFAHERGIEIESEARVENAAVIILLCSEPCSGF